MKENSKLYIIIISVLFIFCLILSNSYVDLRKNNTPYSPNRPCAGSNESYSRIISGIESDNLPLNLKTELTSYSNNLRSLKDVIRPDSMYLILRYPLTYCGDCINEICTRLEMLKDSIPGINVNIIASGGSVREMKVKMHPYREAFPVYLMLLNNFGLPIDRSNIPYLVFTNDGKTAKHTLIVDANSGELLQKYVKMLSNRYCK